MTLSARLPRLARGNGRRSFVLGTALVLFSDSVERQKVFVAVTELRLRSTEKERGGMWLGWEGGEYAYGASSRRFVPW